MHNFDTVYSAWNGGTLVGMVKRKYRDYLRIAVIAYDELLFYERCGFVKSRGASPMFIPSLWT